MCIDHIGLSVSHYKTSKEFFCRALEPLGIQLITETHGWAGFGKDAKPSFWLGEKTPVQQGMHLAFVAENREQVRQFYQAALAAGATDNGGPGIRDYYHPNYYGAFVIGPDGHNIEAVCHQPEA